MALSVGLLANAQTVDLLKPAKDIVLRAPSVPIIVSDPYFSIWSPYDKLMEGSTEHWTSAKKPLLGALRVDGKVYRFLGKDKINLVPIAPMTNVERWEAAYTNSQPSNGWQEFQFDDSNWKKGKAAFGSRDMERIHTEWKGDNTDIYIRRTFDFNEPNIAEDIYLIYSHDDVFELYLNGEKLVSTGLVWKNNVYLKLSEEAKKKLRKGKNVIAAHCHNTTGGSYVDFGLFREKENAVKFANEAVQKSVDVLATSTYYTFTCGPVDVYKRQITLFVSSYQLYIRSIIECTIRITFNNIYTRTFISLTIIINSYNHIFRLISISFYLLIESNASYTISRYSIDIQRRRKHTIF